MMFQYQIATKPTIGLPLIELVNVDVDMSTDPEFERAMNRVPVIMMPSQLSTIIEMARVNSTDLTQIDSPDISDWKKLRTQLSILRFERQVTEQK